MRRTLWQVFIFLICAISTKQASSNLEGKKKQKFDFDICKKASNTRPLDLISALLFPWAIGCQRHLLFVICIVFVIFFVIFFVIVIVFVFVIVCTNLIVTKNLGIVAQWWTLCESHL